MRGYHLYVTAEDLGPAVPLSGGRAVVKSVVMDDHEQVKFASGLDRLARART